MSNEQNKKVHPIVEDVLKLAHQGSNSVEFDDYAIEQIEELLKKYSQEPNFIKAVIDLINLAGILEEQKSHNASMKLIIAVSSVADVLKSLNNSEE